MSIKVTNLSKIFDTQKAVNNITFNINKGEIVGFLGPNGAGKSTTMKMITSYLAPTNGSIEICNISVKENELLTKEKIGYLPEANPLYFDMYIREYLEFVANIHQLKNVKVAIQEAINLVGLNLEANKKIGQISKGYKQRVGLAAALIHNPEVLILDEPTSGLDPNQLLEIRNVIKELGKTKTILFSSHILQEVEAICDRVIIINKGEIVADDKLSNLQNYNNKQFIEFAFKEEVNIEELKTITGVLQINKLDKGFSIQTEEADLVKKALLQFAVDHSLNIESLQSKNQSLESIFKSLTEK